MLLIAITILSNGYKSEVKKSQW